MKTSQWMQSYRNEVLATSRNTNQAYKEPEIKPNILRVSLDSGERPSGRKWDDHQTHRNTFDDPG